MITASGGVVPTTASGCAGARAASASAVSRAAAASSASADFFFFFFFFFFFSTCVRAALTSLGESRVCQPPRHRAYISRIPTSRVDGVKRGTAREPHAVEQEGTPPGLGNVRAPSPRRHHQKKPRPSPETTRTCASSFSSSSSLRQEPPRLRRPAPPRRPTCVEIKILRCVRLDGAAMPACQSGRVIAEK